MPTKSNIKIRPRNYLRAIINLLINPNQILYYTKQIRLVKKFQGRLGLKRYAVDFSRNIDINIDMAANVSFEGKCFLSEGVRISALDSSTITIGDNVFINRNSTIVSRYGVKIGKDCMIAESVFIYDHNHVYSDITTPFRIQGYTGSAIEIGDNVWIGSHVLIGKGVKIGNNTVIAAGAIILKDVPSNSLAKCESKTQISPLKNIQNVSMP